MQFLSRRVVASSRNNELAVLSRDSHVHAARDLDHTRTQEMRLPCLPIGIDINIESPLGGTCIAAAARDLRNARAIARNAHARASRALA